MQIEKELICFNPPFFERIEDYLSCVKELQLKLDECGKAFSNKDGQVIEPIIMNLKTPYDVLCLTFCVGWAIIKEDGKDYTFDSFCGSLIRVQGKLLHEYKLEIKQYTHLLKGKIW